MPKPPSALGRLGAFPHARTVARVARVARAASRFPCSSHRSGRIASDFVSERGLTGILMGAVIS